MLTEQSKKAGPRRSTSERSLHFAKPTVFTQLLPIVRRWWGSSKTCLVEWRSRARSRRELLQFDDRELSDMGLTRMDVYNETRKPFWRK